MLGVSELTQSVAAVQRAPKNLRAHRSFVKRIQLVLTLLTRLSDVLNDDSRTDVSHIVPQCGMKRNIQRIQQQGM